MSDKVRKTIRLYVPNKLALLLEPFADRNTGSSTACIEEEIDDFK